MPAKPLSYNNIGKNYSFYRQPDPRLAQAILMALGDTKKIVNVGAGTGSYEPSDRQIFPTISAIENVLGKIEVQEIPIPHDCVDGFLGAYWRRPSAYLDAVVRSSISAFWRIGKISSGIDRLQADIESGRWAVKNADILQLEQLDLGYRLLVHQIENTGETQ